MGNRLTRIYTRTGDRGETRLGDGSVTTKNAPRIQVIGEVDELNSLLGMLLCEEVPADMRVIVKRIQHELFDLGGELSLPGTALVGAERIKALEAAIERFNAALPPLKEFVLPGGSRAAALCHLARCACRRAERSLVALNAVEAVNDQSLVYLNRLSDLMFVTARALARAQGGAEVLWDRER